MVWCCRTLYCHPPATLLFITIIRVLISYCTINDRLIVIRSSSAYGERARYKKHEAWQLLVPKKNVTLEIILVRGSRSTRNDLAPNTNSDIFLLKTQSVLIQRNCGFKVRNNVIYFMKIVFRLWHLLFRDSFFSFFFFSIFQQIPTLFTLQTSWWITGNRLRGWVLY